MPLIDNLIIHSNDCQLHPSTFLGVHSQCDSKHPSFTHQHIAFNKSMLPRVQSYQFWIGFYQFLTFLFVWVRWQQSYCGDAGCKAGRLGLAHVGYCIMRKRGLSDQMDLSLSRWCMGIWSSYLVIHLIRLLLSRFSNLVWIFDSWKRSGLSAKCWSWPCLPLFRPAIIHKTSYLSFLIRTCLLSFRLYQRFKSVSDWLMSWHPWS